MVQATIKSNQGNYTQSASTQTLLNAQVKKSVADLQKMGVTVYGVDYYGKSATAQRIAADYERQQADKARGVRFGLF